MIHFFRKHTLKLLGIVMGSIAGGLYYNYIGCSSGSCPITSNPYLSITYGAVLGYLLLDIIKPTKND